MTENSAAIVQKVWNYAHVMRDDGLSYGDYVEQITFLIFLKMAQERMEQGKDVRIQKEYQWKALAKLDGDALEIQYRHILEALGKYPGLLGVIFKKAQNKISDPAKLAHLINMIGKEDWSSMSTDVKGDIYEGLLEKNASDVKGGAGQYFTPRPLIRAMVEVMRPKTGMVIADPACGTGGFLLAAYDYIEKHQKLDKGAARHLKEKALRGADIVDSVVRLCAMNLYLHGIGGDESPVESKDALRAKVAEEVDMVLTNPPFGKKSSVTIVGENGEKQQDKMTYERDDFWATTSNKQLNFVQHVVSMLKIGGTAAVVVPDNVLFEGGAGETVRRQLLSRCDVHTLMRLPTGIFYAQGVKANVIFFDRKPASEKPWTKALWIYDFRTNMHLTLKENKLKDAALTDFIKSYNTADRSKRKETERFKRFTYDALVARDKVNLDIFWLKDDSLEDSDNLPDPAILAAEIVEQLEAALEEFKIIEDALRE